LDAVHASTSMFRFHSVPKWHDWRSQWKLLNIFIMVTCPVLISGCRVKVA
jgi:hypothetical protein